MGDRMKGVLYYFSGTGNTKWAAERFTDYFRPYGADVRLVNIEKEGFIEEAYDFIMIGTPVYFGEVPRIVSNFVNSMPDDSDKKKCLIFSVNSEKSQAMIDMLANILRGKGYSIASQINIAMPADYKFNNSGNTLDDSDIINLMDKAALKIKNAVKDFLIDKTTIEGSSRISLIIKKFVMVMNSSKRMRMVRYLDCTTDCIRCGLCVRNCPCGNIAFHNGRVVFYSNCVMCMRCIYICPQKAITYKGSKPQGLSGINLGRLDII